MRTSVQLVLLTLGNQDLGAVYASKSNSVQSMWNLTSVFDSDMESVLDGGLEYQQLIPPPDAGAYIPNTRVLLERDWFEPTTARYITLGLLTSMFVTSAFCCIESHKLSKTKLDDMEIYDSMSYKGTGLLHWTAFGRHGAGTVWYSTTLWIMIRRFTSLAVGVAFLEIIFTRDPSSMDPLRFAEMGSVIRVFVGFLLSFFLAENVIRWLRAVNSFFDLFNAIRNLQMQLHALGVSQERVDLVMRYGVLSAWLHNHSLRGDGRGKETKREWMNSVWTELEKGDHKFVVVTEKEINLLKPALDPGSQVWMMVGTLIGRMAQDGEIPPMASPTYGRIIELIQQAQGSLKDVKQEGFVQVPFTYAHTLAIIVHLNNMIAVISFGLTLGACLGSIMVHIDSDLRLYNDNPNPHHWLIEDCQNLIIQFFKCFFSPILYQACLEIGVSIANPFSAEGSTIPTERLFQELVDDISLANEIAQNPPKWERPQFKAPPAAAAPPK